VRPGVTIKSTLRLPQRAACSPRSTIGPVPAIPAPDVQYRPSTRRAAEGCRSRFAFEGSSTHIPEMQPDLSPEDYAAIAALLRDTIMPGELVAHVIDATT